ncbi:MAG TPA: sensor histidine kinase N-terminal domain-containing protein [Burkholderiales bacterium]|nr:sensor histidine kinase N-terminal domain-containing protein [Burkholderiales bacterium]
MQASLRRHLTYWLLGPLLLLVAAGSFLSYRIALSAANKAYDSALLDPALAIASHLKPGGTRLELDLPSIAIEALRIDTEDRVYYQVLGPAGELIAGTPRLPAPPERLQPGEHIYYDATLEGERVRIAARAVRVETGTAIVQVAETLIKRDKLVLELLVASTVPQVLIAFAAVALLWLGIGQGLRPLDRLRGEIAARSPRDLRPFSERDKPQEVHSLVAALNQLLSRLNAAIASQQRFIANAAHQLRTPLAGLKTHAELARREPSTSELRSLLDMIAAETQRTSHLVNQLLTLARAEPGESPGGQPVNLHEIVGRDVRDWVQRAVGKNIDLGFELEDAWTLGEPLLLRELAANLLDNALAYTQAGGSVTVRTGVRNGESVLEVEDNGPGIPEAEREKVFERFYRVPATGGEGCGLGLSIVSEIAERHSARIELADSAGGRGTLIRAVFPRLAAQAAPSAPPVSTRAVPTPR